MTAPDADHTPDPALVELAIRAAARSRYLARWPDADVWRVERYAEEMAADPAYRAEICAAVFALAAEGRLLPEPTETRTEWGVWWHSGDSDGIVLSEYKIGSRECAERRGKERIGEYGITRYTLRRREHRVYADGSTWIGAREKVADDDA